jgi:hypothetical protein
MTSSSSRWDLIVLACDIFVFFHFGVPFCTHQKSINEDTRAFIHFSNTEECANASAKLNRVNISCENGTPNSSFVVLRYKQSTYSFMDKFIKIART